MAEIAPRPIFGPSGYPIGQKFLCAQKRYVFPPARSPAPPPFIFFDNGLVKKKIFFNV